MEPAKVEQLKEAIQTQGTLLGQHENMLRGVAGSLEELTRQVLLITNQLSGLSAAAGGSHTVSSPPSSSSAPLPHVSSPIKEPFVCPPEVYSGDFGSCSRFLFNCHLVFKMQPSSYSTDEAKVAYVVNLLRGRAAKWATALWEGESDILSSFDLFSAQLRQVFNHPIQGQVASKRLLAVRQGSQSVADYSVDFQILAKQCGWDDQALKALFINGLSEELKDELATRDDPHSLRELYSLCIRLDNRLRERSREKFFKTRRVAPSPGCERSSPLPASTLPALPPTTPPAAVEEPMQLGKTRLSHRERQRRQAEHRCLYCGGEDHTLPNCPNQPKDRTHR